MGSQEIQNKLWGRQTEDWASIQEKTGISGYEYALNQLELNKPVNLLDIGCGSGIFSDFAQLKAIEHYVQPDGTVVYNNKWRVVTATK